MCLEKNFFWLQFKYEKTVNVDSLLSYSSIGGVLIV